MTDEHSITDPREMRQRFSEMRRGRSFYDNRVPSAVDTIVRHVHDAAEIQGLSGEDRYTMLAWHLMLMAARLEKVVMDEALMSPGSWNPGIASNPEYQREQQEKNRKARAIVDGLMTKEDLEAAMRRNGCRHPRTMAIDPAHNDGEVLRCVDCGARLKPDCAWSRP